MNKNIETNDIELVNIDSKRKKIQVYKGIEIDRNVDESICSDACMAALFRTHGGFMGEENDENTPIHVYVECVEEQSQFGTCGELSKEKKETTVPESHSLTKHAKQTFVFDNSWTKTGKQHGNIMWLDMAVNSSIGNVSLSLFLYNKNVLVI